MLVHCGMSAVIYAKASDFFCLTTSNINTGKKANNVLVLFGEGNGTPLQYSCLENPMEEPGRLQSMG